MNQPQEPARNPLLADVGRVSVLEPGLGTHFLPQKQQVPILDRFDALRFVAKTADVPN